ncbi:MAG TPA: hypothetical protein VMM57_05075 [Bacteroidota bacterium]|nr:hypothetical protein [Bacteroidota bacterium]
MNRFSLILVGFIFFLSSCSSPPPEKKEEVLRPAITFQVASLNIGGVNRRIEKKDISALARILKREQIEILAVQGITRYPGLETRVDFVSELSSQAEMRNAFGEMMNNSGRQTGNAVFSSYPIRSNVNRSFDGVKSATFEAALQTVIDGGVRDIAVVSAQLPQKAGADDQSQCVRAIAAFNTPDRNYPTVVAGNLPMAEAVRTTGAFDDTRSLIASDKSIPSRIWYDGRNLLKPLSARVVETEFGPMVVAQFGIYNHPLP